MLPVQSIHCKKDHRKLGNINILWDSGSTLSFVTFRKARALGLKGIGQVNLHATKVGKTTELITSERFVLTLIDNNHNKIEFTTFGIDKISNVIVGINIDSVKDLFPGLNWNKLNQPSCGEIDCLIGFDLANYHPMKKYVAGNLLILENQFGYVIGGRHPELVERYETVVKEANSLHIIQGNVRVKDFYRIEQLGIEVLPKCGPCRCGECQPGGSCMSLKEEREYKMIEKGLTYDEKEKRYTSKYPYIKDPRNLPNNRSAVFGTLKAQEKRLRKNPDRAGLYQSQIEDMIKRNVCRKVEDIELENYVGPLFYIAHHEVMKESSKSMRCRIVFHSSQKFRGHSLNDFLAKGPDMLNNLLGVLLKV